MTEQPGANPPVPPAFTSNGHGPSAKIAELVEQLPDMLAGAVAGGMSHVLNRVTVQTRSPYRCTQCVMNRLAWVNAHEKATSAAQETYMRAVTELASLPDGDPRRGIHLEFTMFLPDDLRPGGGQGMPPLADGVVLISGSAWCMEHVPGAPGKTQLLIATSSLTPGMWSSLAA
jgi:hypothetical protein